MAATEVNGDHAPNVQLFTAATQTLPLDGSPSDVEGVPHSAGESSGSNHRSLLSRETSPISHRNSSEEIIVADEDHDVEKASRLKDELSEYVPTSRLRWFRKFLHRSILLLGRIVRDSWWPEVLALCLSAGCLVATTIILSMFNNRPLPQLPSGLTLNTIIAVLAAASKSSLVFAVSATMSQCKWCWLQTRKNARRRLGDLQDMDDASHGPLGSVLILCSHMITSMISIGAIIMVVGVVYEPFVQQLVSYPARDIKDTSVVAAVDQALAISRYVDMESRTILGIYSNSFPSRTPPCPTGNCTWEPFWSAGWCTKCEKSELTSLNCNFSLQEIIDKGENMTKECTFSSSVGVESVDLPVIFEANTWNIDDTNPNSGNGMVFALNYTPFWSLVDAYDGPYVLVDQITQYFADTHTVLQQTNPLISLGYAGVPNLVDSLAKPLAQTMLSSTCILSPCSRQYNISVENGIPAIETLEEDFGLMYSNDSLSDITDYHSLCWRPTSSDPENVNLERVSKEGLNSPYDPSAFYLDREHRAWCGEATIFYYPITNAFNGSVKAVWDQSQRYPWVWYDQNIQINGNLPHIVDPPTGQGTNIMPSIAESLTYGNLHPQVAPTTEDERQLFTQHLTRFHGTVLLQKAFVVVRWPWVALPATLNVLSIIFLPVTAIYTRRNKVPLWKSSIFAFLYHGLEDRSFTYDQLPHNTASEMEDSARTALVSLRPGTPSDERGEYLLLRP